MKQKFKFTEHSLKQFKKLPEQTKLRIKKKLTYLEQLENPLNSASALKDFGRATHKFPIGDYRILCCQEKQTITILILKVGHRREIYRKKT